jgi:transposase
MAPLPSEKVFPGARPGPNLLSTLAIHKTVDGLPLHRIQRMLGRVGRLIPVQTLNRWEDFGHELVSPLIRQLHRLVQNADVIHLDDTSLKVRVPDHPNGIKKGHIWVFSGRIFDPGGDLRKTQLFVAYLYTPT